VNAALAALYAFMSLQLAAALLLAWLARKGLLRGTVSVGRARRQAPKTGERM
jgi:hypothetical protein